MEPFDNHAVAKRLRDVLGHASLDELAAKLRVSRSALQSALDEQVPRPTVQVVAAVVATFAVDPTWILTGEYNPMTHRRVAGPEGEAERVVESLMKRTNPAGSDFKRTS